jgi:cell division inhibitor SulA
MEFLKSSALRSNPKSPNSKKKNNQLKIPPGVPLWNAKSITEVTPKNTGTPTGFNDLDTIFYNRGWPQGGLTEFLHDTSGIGELRLMAPALSHLSQNESRWITWINPPYIPYAPALEALGINHKKILLIHPQNHKEALWSLEKALQSGTCSAALAWLDEKQLALSDIRRLQVRAKQGNTWATLFRPAAAIRQASSAELRLHLLPAVSEDKITVSVIKRRGGWAIPDMSIDLREFTPTRKIQKKNCSISSSKTATSASSTTHRTRIHQNKSKYSRKQMQLV